MFGRADTLIRLMLKGAAGRQLKYSSRRTHPHHRHSLPHTVRRLYMRPRTRALPEPLSSCRSDCQRTDLERHIQGSPLLRYNIVEQYRCTPRHTRRYSDKGVHRPARSGNLRARRDIHYDNLRGSHRSSDRSSDPRRRHTHRRVHTVGTLVSHNIHRGKYLRCTQVERRTSNLNKHHRGSHRLEHLHNSARCYTLDPHHSPDRHCRAGCIPVIHFALQVHTDIRHDTPKSRCMA